MNVADFTDAQIDALIALEGHGERRVPAEELRPLVERECICTNHHQPDAMGFIWTSPACGFHGLEARVRAIPPPIDENAPLREVVSFSGRERADDAKRK